MRVLWFSITPALYNGQKASAGTWIESLLDILKDEQSLELGIAFCTTEKKAKNSMMGNISYYPMYRGKAYTKFLDKMTTRFEDKQIVAQSLNVINDFKPDLIHIFGSEWCFGLIKEHTDIPIVIHMQGSWPSYRLAVGTRRAYFAKELLRMWYNPFYLLGRRLAQHKSTLRAKREEHILSINENYMGRTKWDKALINLFAPKAKYYHCEEALRPDFRNSSSWQMKDTKKRKIRLVSVGSNSTLKGYTLALQTASILKKFTNLGFEWTIIGPSVKFLKQFEFESNLKFADNNFNLKGRCSSEDINKILLDSDIYVHTACIDNSPNAICEAQYLGMPIITTGVGGIISLFDDNYPSEYFVSSNDPYYLASMIWKLSGDVPTMEQMSHLNSNIARKRHAPEHIRKELMVIYNDLIKSDE